MDFSRCLIVPCYDELHFSARSQAVVLQPGFAGAALRADELGFGVDWASSPNPALMLNSIGHRQNGAYYPSSLPRAKYHQIMLADRPTSLDPKLVPEGREDPITRPPAKAVP